MGAIIPRFDRQSLKRMFDIELVNMEDSIIRAFELVGMEAVNEAVASGSYTDRTGNLRNSVAYVVAVDGKIVAEFHKNDYGREYAEKILREAGDGIVLVVVAGMDYAVYVEARGYVVLSSAEKMAEKRLPNILKQLAGENNN